MIEPSAANVNRSSGARNPVERVFTRGSTSSEISQPVETIATTSRYGSMLKGSWNGSVYRRIGTKRIVTTISDTSELQDSATRYVEAISTTMQMTGAITFTGKPP